VKKEMLLVANWKMYGTKKEGIKLISAIKSGLKNLSTEGLTIVLCPPFTFLEKAKESIEGTRLKLGAQNCHFLPCGAYTGEISPLMLVDYCQYVIIGHSERRRYFFETDQLINEKIKAALEAGLRPIVCVGEKQKKHKKEKDEEVLNQVKAAVADLDNKKMAQLIFAYEPVWAIGTGNEADPSYANRMSQLIKESLPMNVPVLYGGSVEPDNVLGFFKQKMIDGVLIGGASLQASQFLKIIQKARRYVSQP